MWIIDASTKKFFYLMLRRPLVTQLRKSFNTIHLTRRWRSEIATGSLDEKPTVAELDKLFAQSRSYDAKKVWTHTFTRMSDSFTRQQLYELARSANLKDMKASTPKAMIVKAFLEQRFNLTDPNEEAASIFVRLPMSSVFLLTQCGALLFKSAQNFGAQVYMGKSGNDVGVAITGTKRAVQNMQDWLETFEGDIQYMSTPYRPQAHMLPWIMKRTQCHVSQDTGDAKLAFLHPYHAQQATMLLEQQMHVQPLQWENLWSFTPDRHVTASPLPFCPSSMADPSDEFNVSLGTWTRLSGGISDLPNVLCHLNDASLVDPLAWLSSRAYQMEPASDPSVMVDGPWESHLSLTFGHILWKDQPCITQPLTSHISAPAFFFESELPNATTQTPYIPGWTEMSMDELETERIYYRGLTPWGPMDLVVMHEMQHEQLVPRACWWQYEMHVPILCPFSPVDVCLTAVNRAPTRLDVPELIRTVDSDDSFRSLPTTLSVEFAGTKFWRLWRSERIVQRTSSYTHTDHPNELIFHRVSLRRNSMPHFSHITRIDFPTWSNDYIGILTSLLRTSYPTLGKQ